MARKPTEHGRRITICAKLSEAEAAALDNARGTLTRGEWLRSAALAALASANSTPHPPQDTHVTAG